MATSPERISTIAELLEEFWLANSQYTFAEVVETLGLVYFTSDEDVEIALVSAMSNEED
jgi:hypothetical protein